MFGALATPAGLSAAGNFLGGIGAIAGAFGNKGPNANDAHHSMLMGVEQAQRQFDLRMDLAAKHGLHPLTVLGVPMGGGSIPVMAGDTGPDLQSLGHGMSNIGRSMVKPPEADPLDVRLKEATVRRAEAEANAAEWNALNLEFQTADLARGVIGGQPGLPPPVHSSNDATVLTRKFGALADAQSGIPGLTAPGSPVQMEQKITPPHPTQLGVAAGSEPLYVTVWDQNGKPVRMLNPKALQGDTEMPFSYLWLANRYGNEAAVNMMPAVENAGPLGAALAAIAYLGKKGYEYFGQQRRAAEQRTGKYTPQWRYNGLHPKAMDDAWNARRRAYNQSLRASRGGE